MSEKRRVSAELNDCFHRRRCDTLGQCVRLWTLVSLEHKHQEWKHDKLASTTRRRALNKHLHAWRLTRALSARACTLCHRCLAGAGRVVLRMWLEEVMLLNPNPPSEYQWRAVTDACASIQARVCSKQRLDCQRLQKHHRLRLRRGVLDLWAHVNARKRRCGHLVQVRQHVCVITHYMRQCACIILKMESLLKNVRFANKNKYALHAVGTNHPRSV